MKERLYNACLVQWENSGFTHRIRGFDSLSGYVGDSIAVYGPVVGFVLTLQLRLYGHTGSEAIKGEGVCSHNGDHLDSTSFKAATSEGLGGGFDSHVLHMSNLIGRTAMIARGPFKGLVGKIVQQKDDTVTIEIGSERHTVFDKNIIVE